MRYLVLLLFLALSGPSWAALPPQSSELLLEGSSDVVVGTVVKLKSWSERVKYGRDEVFVALLRVDSVEKGKLQPGVLIEVHYRQTQSRAKGWVGPQGQSKGLEQGQTARLYLNKSEGVYRLLEPNGWSTP